MASWMLSAAAVGDAVAAFAARRRAISAINGLVGGASRASAGRALPIAAHAAATGLSFLAASSAKSAFAGLADGALPPPLPPAAGGSLAVTCLSVRRRARRW